MNFSFDDSSAELSYSNGWGIQSSSDPDLDSFFQSTYHVAETVGASVNFTCNASAVYIYGSKGPAHVRRLGPPKNITADSSCTRTSQGTFSVQFDNSVTEGSAFATETMYQQLLWELHVIMDNQLHLVNFIANPGGVNAGQGSWVDIDFILLTDG